jgi:hypothetical protein
MGPFKPPRSEPCQCRCDAVGGATAAPTPSEHGALRYARRAAAERMRSLLKRSPCVCFPPSKLFTRAALSARRLSRCRGRGLCPCRRVPVYYSVAVRRFTQSNPSSSTKCHSKRGATQSYPLSRLFVARRWNRHHITLTYLIRVVISRYPKNTRTAKKSPESTP